MTIEKRNEEKWFTDIVEELYRTGCGPDCEGPTAANERAKKLAIKNTHPKAK